MKFSFRPTEGAFFDLFSRAAQNLVKGTELLNELALQGADVQAVSDRLTDVEHDSDQITHDLYKKINSTFITPFDREDIYSLGSQLDDVMDHLEAVGNLLYLYGLTELPSLPREMHELVNVLDQQANPALAVGQDDPDAAGAGVLADVGERLLGDPEDGGLDLRREGARLALDGALALLDGAALLQRPDLGGDRLARRRPCSGDGPRPPDRPQPQLL